MKEYFFDSIDNIKPAQKSMIKFARALGELIDLRYQNNPVVGVTVLQTCDIAIITNYNVCCLTIVEVKEKMNFIRYAGCSFLHPHLLYIENWGQMDAMRWNMEWNRRKSKDKYDSTSAAIYIEMNRWGILPVSFKEAIERYNKENILRADNVIWAIERNWQEWA